MVRTVKNGREEDDFEEDHEFASAAPEVSSSKGKVEKTSDQKANPVRSKHSETEQRRRSKINERFQVLRDLIPENDQKRDKASFLLEVIQYIQFLQERIRAYEGTCQGWSLEPSKLMSWQRSVLGSIDHFLDQPQLIRDGSVSEDNVAVSSKLLTSSQNSIDSDFSGSALYGMTDNTRVEGSHGITPVQANLFEVVSAHPSQESFPEPDFHLADQFHSQQWLSKSSPEYVEGGHDPVKPEKLIPSSVESSISHDYSQRVSKTLSNALHSSGVDLSHTSISVQLDVRRQTDGGSHTAAATLDGSTFSEIGCYAGTTKKHGGHQANKKLKTRDSVS